jgi:hypothetical protein
MHSTLRTITSSGERATRVMKLVPKFNSVHICTGPTNSFRLHSPTADGYGQLHTGPATAGQHTRGNTADIRI